MGLDMYFFTQPTRTHNKDREELCYWRKHNRLHGWFADRWVADHPDQSVNDFNCKELWLTTDMLDQLQEAIEQRNLETTPGFFFGGEYPYNDETAEADLQDIRKARRELKAGKHVCYYSWW